MLAGYARHGFGRQALLVFDSMKTAGFKPDEITMVRIWFSFYKFHMHE
jgi:pentatricopeptide repeat protein